MPILTDEPKWKERKRTKKKDTKEIKCAQDERNTEFNVCRNETVHIKAEK